MMRSADWSGLVTRVHPPPALRGHRPLRRLSSHLLRQYRGHGEEPITPLQRLNAGSSPCCSVTWSIPPSSHRNLTQKTTERWCVHISGCVPRLSSATMGISLNYLVTGSSCTSAILKPMKMTPKEQYGLVWEFLLLWET